MKWDFQLNVIPILIVPFQQRSAIGNFSSTKYPRSKISSVVNDLTNVIPIYATAGKFTSQYTIIRDRVGLKGGSTYKVHKISLD
jgi:hypothetical protein